MSLLKSLIGLLAVSLLVFSCKKEFSDEDGKVPGFIESTWEFKEAGTQFHGDMDSAYFHTAAGFNALSLIGTLPDGGNGEIILQVISENIVPGTYTSPGIFFQYIENGSILYQTVPGQTSNFSITITEIDSVSVSGTFSGTVQDPQGNPHTIEDGKFSVAMTEGYQQGPPPNGQLTVWAKEICFDGSSIEVKVKDQTGFISDALLTEPACGEQNTATFTLPQGLYTVTAICGPDTLKYDVNLNSDCVKLFIDFVHPPLFEDYLPLTHNSYWDYNDLSNSSTTQRATALGDTVIDGRLYTMVINTLPDTSYYRKEANVYYEYRTFDFNQYVINPPSFEMEILHDDYQVNQTWETPPIDLVLSGIGVKVKLVSTLTRRDYSDTFNGTQYDNLIEVQSEIYFSSDDGVTYQSSGSIYSTVYAKGKGIVYYYDLGRTIEWGITGLSITP
jgi:hypothetical protein